MYKGMFQRINSRSVGLKMARRDVSRNKLQSFLVVFIIAMPVALGAFALTYRESNQPTASERVEYYLGITQAKLVANLAPSEHNFQTPLDQYVTFVADGEYYLSLIHI